MVGFALGVQARVEEPFQKMELLNRIDVTPRARTNDSTAALPPEPAALNEAALGRIAALPGVVLAYPDFRLSGVEVVFGESRTKATAIGLPAEAGNLAFVRESLIAGRFIVATDQVVLGKRLAKDLGFSRPGEAVGEPLVLEVRGLVPSNEGAFHAERRQVRAVVAGVWDPPGGQHGFAADSLVLPLQVIRDLPGVHFDSTLLSLFERRAQASKALGRAVVRVRRASDLFLVEQRIQKMGFETQTLLGQLKQMRTAFIVMDLVLTAVGTVALVVAGLAIINTQLMAVLERFREIGVYKALGASDADVRILFLAEAALVGLLGGGGGLILGLFVSWILGWVVNAVAHKYEIDGPIMVFDFPWVLLSGAILFALLVSLLSGLYPASRAARVDPIRALRSE
jgi:putative ABC transport system permease protein